MRPARFGALLILAVILSVGVAFAQSYVRVATDADRVIAALDVSENGRTVTIRGAAPGDLRVCVAPAAHAFGPTRCFVVEEIRKGALTLR